MKLPCLNPHSLVGPKWRATWFLMFALCSMASARSIYVDNTLGNDGNDGATWNTAYKTFKKACQTLGSDGTIDKIFLAQGTYYPTGDQSGTNRSTYFHIQRGVSIYGGYPTGGAATADPTLYPTILSGNINNPNSKTDNSLHVVLIHGFPSGNVLIDGVTIQDGRADGSSSGDIFRSTWGSAVFIDILPAVNIEFNRVNFRDNYVYDPAGPSMSFGGTVLVLGPKSKFTYCKFTGNEADGGTAGVFAQLETQFINCLFTGNKATFATVFKLGGPLLLINSTVSGNIATNETGVIYAPFGPDLKAYNSIIYGNSRGISFYNVSTGIVSQNSLIQGYTDTSNGNLNGDLTNPLFRNALSPGSAPTNSGDYLLIDGSPCINSANISLLPAGFPTDLSGGPRILQGLLDMGPYETPIECSSSDLYVDASRATDGNGSSWASALRSLSGALSRAAACPVVTRIFVAQGTYYPTGIQNGTQRDSTFLITRGNLKIYGGYSAGGGTRNIDQYPTILSGDIGSAGAATDNSLHVMVIAGVPADADSLVINGVTISGGNASIAGTKDYNGEAFANDYGGGIAARGNASARIMLENVTLTANSADWGGGMAVTSGKPVHLLRSKVISNTVTGYGAGILFENLSPETVASVRSALIAGNAAQVNGGGVINKSAKVEYVNCLLSGNSAVSAGGVLNYLATTTFVNCTITGNRAGAGENAGGGVLDGNTSQTYIYNTIVAGNSTNFTRDGAMLPVIYNSLVQGWTLTDNNNIHQNTNPDFRAPVAWQSAPTTAGDYRLLVFSPCIDKGDNARLPAGLSVDFNGDSRIAGSSIDLGAMEWICPGINTLYVDGAVATSGDGSTWGSSMKTLAEAVEVAARCSDIAEIRVAQGTYLTTAVSTDSDRDKTLLITRGGLKIIGGYPSGGGTRDLVANPTILSGDIGVVNDASDNAYHVMVIAHIQAEADSLVLDGLNFRMGNANGTGSFQISGIDIHRYTGGAIFLRANANGQKLALRNCSFSNNNAGDGAGAVFIEGADPQFTSCDFFTNTGGNGGAMQTIYASPRIVSSKFRGNTASGNGGGLLNINSSPTLINCALTGNLSAFGAGIYNYTAAPSITNCVIAGNKATSNQGGGFYNTASSAPVFTNSIVYGNSGAFVHVGAGPIVNYSLVEGFTGSGPGNLNGQAPAFVQQLGPDSAPTIDGDYSLTDSSPCIDAASSEALSADITLDLNRKPRLVGSLVDMGPYEYQVLVCSPGNELFVDANTASAGNGNSWATPLRTLKQALDRANLCGNVQIIRVAKGTYYPNGVPESTDRWATFRIRRGGLKLIGGYPSGGGVRDVVNNETVLNGNQGDPGSSEDNAFHVVLIGGFSLSDSIVIDGLTISGGNANVDQTYNDGALPISINQGGGMYLRDLAGASLLQIRNTTFRDNYGWSGGGIYTENAPLTVTRSRFSQNSSTYGGAFSSRGSAINFFNSLLTDNVSYVTGGAGLVGYGSAITLHNCTVTSNNGTGSKSFYVLNASLTFHNSIVHGSNEAFEAWGSSVTIKGSLVNGLNSTDNGNLPGNTNPMFVNPVAGDYHLSQGSAAINAGFNHLATDYPTDFDNKQRIASLRVDIGAYETDCAAVPAPDDTSISRAIAPGDNYLFNACNLIALLAPQGAQPIAGEITARSLVKDQLTAFGNARFVRRQYEITPATNATDATAKVTLYFTKEDFGHYNEQFGTGNGRELPVEPGDNTANLLVVKYAGTGNANGDPSSYGARSFISPTATWDATLGLWAVQFDVTGFSGFFITGQLPDALPVILAGFTASRQEQDVILNWTTASEIDASHFEIERSFDARSFEKIGSVPVQQQQAALRYYAFMDSSPFKATKTTLYYRLKMVDLDRSYTYSRIVSVTNDGPPDELNVYPTVSTGIVTLETKSGDITGVEIYDSQGRAVPFTLNTPDKNKFILKLHNAQPGIFILRVRRLNSNSVRKLIVE